MVSVHEETPAQKRAPWRRTPFQRRLVDFRRLLIRHRLLLRSVGVAFVLGLFAGAIALGLPRWIERGAELAKTSLGEGIGLRVSVITTQGLKHLSQQDVEDALAIAAGAPLLDVDVAAARARVMSLGWVKDATVLRMPPNRLHVVVTEYEPQILWQQGGHSFVADAQGHVIATVDPARYGALFHVTGAGAAEAAPDLIAWLNARPEVMKHVIFAERVGDLRWNLHFGNQQVIELPDHGLDEALAVLERMITKDSLLRRDIVLVDLRDPAKPRLRLGDDAVRALHAPHENS